MAVTGLWNIGNFNLPDYGVTEGINKILGGNVPFLSSTQNSGLVKSAWAAEGDNGTSQLQGTMPMGTTGNTPISSISGTSLTSGPGGAYPQAPTNTTTTNTGGTSGGEYSFNMSDFPNYAGWDPTAAMQDWIAKGRPSPGGQSGGGAPNPIYGILEQGYNDYFSQLNNLMGGLGTQAEAQTGIATNSYNQSNADLLANKQASLGDLATSERKLQENQVKNLRDITSNLQNQYMAGNVMLGARGAGDSSAANQYSYALNRLGSKERGNVMNQTASLQGDIEDRKAKLNNIVAQEQSRLDTEFNNAKLGVSSWLAEQQNAIRAAIADGTLKKSQDIANATQTALNTALQQFNTMKSNIEGRQNALREWAMNNATNINQLKTNMAGIAQFNPTMPTAQTLNGSVSQDAQGNIRGLFGYGNQEKRDIYGNVIG